MRLGVLHHLMTRGIERRNIPLGDEDEDDFVRRLATSRFCEGTCPRALFPSLCQINKKGMDRRNV